MERTRDARRGTKEGTSCQTCSFTIIPLGETPNRRHNDAHVFDEGFENGGGHHEGRRPLKRHC